MTAPEDTIPYRKLTDAEYILMREALGPMTPADFKSFSSWSNRLRDPIVEAIGHLPGARFEYARKDDILKILAMYGNGRYAISPELQDGVTKEMLMTIKVGWTPWKYGHFFFRHEFSTACFFASIILATVAFGLDVNPKMLWLADWIKLISVMMGATSLVYLVGRFYKEPLDYYKHLAELSKEVLEVQTARTPAEVAADNAEMLKRLPTHEAVKRTMGINDSPTAIGPKPA